MTNAITATPGGADRWQVLRLLVSRKTVLISLIVLIVLIGAALLAPGSALRPHEAVHHEPAQAPGAAHGSAPTISAATYSAA